MIDLHCHILPGIDDGPATMEESVAMARSAQAAGIEAIVATPHVSWRYPNEPSTIASLTAELNERLASEEIPVQIYAGAEVAMTRVAEMKADELAQMTLGNGPWLLLEPPFVPIVTGLELVVAELQRAGHRILLAHPERCPAFHRDLHLLQALVDAGALTSITATSLTGRFGGEVRRFTMALAAKALVHNVASDAHDVHRRPPGIAAELSATEMAGLSDWLTSAVPTAVLTGTDIPPRPCRPQQTPRTRLGWRGRRQRS